jgi:hypothetical protein
VALPDDDDVVELSLLDPHAASPVAAAAHAASAKLRRIRVIGFLSIDG